MTKEYIEILDVYFRLNKDIKHYFNIPLVRKIVEKKIKDELPFIDRVICDESNNPPSVIDRGEIVASVIYNKVGYRCNILDLVFGNDVEKHYYKPYLRYKKLEKLKKIMNL